MTLLAMLVVRLVAAGDVVDYMDRLLPVRDVDELAVRWDLALAIVAVTDDAQERRQLARIARFESNFRGDVMRCEVLGPEGEVTAWQILARPGEDAQAMCEDVELAAAVALERVRESVALCKHLPAPERLAVYARGSCSSVIGRRLSRVRYAP